MSEDRFEWMWNGNCRDVRKERQKWNCMQKRARSREMQSDRQETDLSLSAADTHTSTRRHKHNLKPRLIIKEYLYVYSGHDCDHNRRHMTVRWSYLHQRRVSAEEMSLWDIGWHPLHRCIQSHYNWKSLKKFVRKRIHACGTCTHCVNLILWCQCCKFLFVWMTPPHPLTPP